MQPFKIPVKDLKEGKNSFTWHADGEFFGTFENSEILDAELEIEVCVDYEVDSMEVSGQIDGTVRTVCDRCLSELELPVHTSFDDDELEIGPVIDLSQDIYDFACISLPMQKVHPEGGCDEETVKY
ncbi:MAG: DUF177 domain-containing protein, partial [Bacteroidales bacterium]|nr:DUF177 domain-containing protein [Candidatus Cacconaster merdequi]